MERSSLLYRGILILASLIIALVVIYPPKDKINLGLDLQGGMHLVLQRADRRRRPRRDRQRGRHRAARARQPRHPLHRSSAPATPPSP